MKTEHYYELCRNTIARLNLALLRGEHPGQPTDVIRITKEDTGEEIKKARYVYLTALPHSDTNPTGLAKTEDDEYIPAVSIAELFIGKVTLDPTKMTVSHAARCLVNQTHRVSTAEEIQGHLERQARVLKAANEKDVLNFKLRVNGEFPQKEVAPLPRSSKILVPLTAAVAGKGKDGQA